MTLLSRIKQCGRVWFRGTVSCFFVLCDAKDWAEFVHVDGRTLTARERGGETKRGWHRGIVGIGVGLVLQK